MRRVLFDENVPRNLRLDLSAFEIHTVSEQGWAGLKNGQLLNEGVTDLRPHESKVSTRLAELISPDVDVSETRDSYHALVSLGAMAWNIAVVPKGEQAGLIGETVREATKAGLPLTEKWLTLLVRRKTELFPNDHRFIESFEVREEANGKFTVIVASLGPR